MNPILLGIGFALLLGIGLATWKAPRLTGILWWSLAATILFSAALLLTLPVAFDQLALWLTLAVPLIWMCFMFLCYWDSNKWRMTASLILLSAVSGVTIALVPPPA